jgi:hypothetical protein
MSNIKYGEHDALKDYVTLRGMTKLIKNKAVREFTEHMMDNEIPDYFREVSASSSGKYHPVYALGTGGLVRHTIAAVKFVVHITSLEYLRIDALTRDKMISATILHDAFKQGRKGETGHTVKDHHRVVYEEILRVSKETEGMGELGESIARLALTHMGEWTPNSKPGNRIEFLVHLADYLSSRKDVLIDFDIPTELRK